MSKLSDALDYADKRSVCVGLLDRNLRARVVSAVIDAKDLGLTDAVAREAGRRRCGSVTLLLLGALVNLLIQLALDWWRKRHSAQLGAAPRRASVPPPDDPA